MAEFPAPVGGTVLPDDFAPSILFAILYASLLPLMLYRMIKRQSRCLLLIGTITFSIERVVIFCLRAVQARNDFSPGLVTYFQISFAVGFIGIANDAVKLTRCLLVNATYGPETYPQSPAAASGVTLVPPPTSDTPDQPRVRFWSRRVCGILDLAFLAAIVLASVANANYSQVFDSQQAANMTASVRLASSIVAIALAPMAVHATWWGYRNLPRVSKRGVTILVVIYTLIIIIGTYRLSVMWARTTSLTAPSVFNTPGGKIIFYVFHILPEWLAILMLHGENIRETFGTGLVGDWRRRDETEKQRAKREEREAKRKEKKMQLVEVEKQGYLG